MKFFNFRGKLSRCRRKLNYFMSDPAGAAAVGAAVLLLAGPAFAFNQPPANLSVTTFLDGGAPPGLYYLNYVIFVDGRRAVDHKGDTIPGEAKVGVLTHLTQLYWVSPWTFLGGKLAFDYTQPLVAITAQGLLGPFPVTANRAGLGDPQIGPALQWDGGTLFGKPIFQRVESNVSVPIGLYDKNRGANPGTNLWSVDSYYSAVWRFAEAWETSWRLWYAYHGQNPATGMKPGQRAHVNFAASRALGKQWRLGAAGYVFRQLADDKVYGARMADSRERVFGLGPGLVYHGQGLTAMLSHPFEFWGQNRFIGSRTTLQLIHRF